MNAVERCPNCRRVVIPRTNGTGQVYLECPTGDWGEAIERKADPYPTTYRVHTDTDGRTRKRAHRTVPIANHMAKKTIAKAGSR